MTCFDGKELNEIHAFFFTEKTNSGWSIHQVVLDFTGGLLSIFQQILSAYNTDDWGLVTDNFPKLILGGCGIVFGSTLMVQHFVLYGDNGSPERQSKALLLRKQKGSAQKKRIINHSNYSSVVRGDDTICI